MKKEELALLAQLITAMEDASQKLEKAHEEKDLEEFSNAKKAIQDIQSKIDKIL